MKHIITFMSAGIVFIAVSFLNKGYAATEDRKGVELLLTKDGQPAATIVIDREATRPAQFAAFELQFHIGKISGARLPIVRDDADESAIKGVRILVGESAFTRKLGLRNEDFSNQEYLIKFLPDTLVLMGRDAEDFLTVDYDDPDTFPGLPIRRGGAYGTYEENATCYAVYDFLEKHCGVRWYLPTDLGMVCPAQKTLLITDGRDERRSPTMVYREMTHLSSISVELGDEAGLLLPGRERRLFALRWRLGGEPYACNHAFYLYYLRYLKDHPEWFAQGYDHDMPEELRNTPREKRTVDTTWRGYPKLYYPNMCYAGTGFIQQVIASARNYFDTGKTLGGESAAGNYFTLGPMDSGGVAKYCKCDKCLPRWEPTWKNPPCNEWRKQYFFFDDKVSDYLFGFVNEVARELAKTHPDKYVTQLAYQQLYYPPTREPLEPNVAVTLCMYHLFRATPNMDRAAIEFMDRWDALAPKTQKYLWLWFCYPGDGISERCFPPFMAREIVRQANDYNARGYRGVFAEARSIPGKDRKPGYSVRKPNVSLLESYLLYKLAYDGTLDGNELIDEFFTLFYGAAGPAMQKLYEAIESVYCDPDNYSGAHAARMGVPFSPSVYFGFQNQGIAWGLLGNRERMAEFAQLMEAAESAALTDMEKKRVALFRKNIWERMEAGAREAWAWLEEEARKSEEQQKSLAALGAELPAAVFGDWVFMKDTGNKGMEEGWYRAGMPKAEGWVPVTVPALLQDTAIGAYFGYGWYRTTLKLPPKAEGRMINLHFGAVDEQAWVYVNGQLVGEHTVESEGLGVGKLWDKAFTICITPDHIKAGEENLLVVRMHASVGASGIWRPVTAYMASEDYTPVP